MTSHTGTAVLGDRHERRASMSRAARGSALNLAGAAVSAVSNFLLTVAVTRGAPKDVAGTLFAVTALFLLASSIGRLGTDTGLVYFISRARADGDAGRVRGYVRTAGRPVVLVAALMAVLMLASAPLVGGALSRSQPRLATEYLLALAVLVPCVGLENVALSATRGLGTMRPNALIEQIGRPLLQYGVVLAALTSHSTAWLSVAWGVCYAPAAAAAWASLRRRLRALDPGQTSPRLHNPEFWKFTAPRSVASIMQLALQRLDIVLVAIIAGPAPAAVYTAATRFVVVGQMGRNAVSLAVQPAMAQTLHRGDRRATNALYQATTAWLMLVTWPIYLTLCVDGQTVLTLFGHGYASGATVLVLVAAAMLVATLCGDVDIVLIMAGRTWWSLVNVASALTVNVVLDVVLIPRLGILGAAIGWAVAIVTKNLSALVQVQLVLKLHPFGRATLLAALLSIVPFGVLPLVANRLVEGSALRLATLAGGCLLFLVGAVVLRRPLQLTAFIERRRSGVQRVAVADPVNRGNAARPRPADAILPGTENR